MKVKELRFLIANLPGDMEVVIEAPDHEFRKARARDVLALTTDGAGFTEWYEDREPSDEERALYGSRVHVLLVS